MRPRLPARHLLARARARLTRPVAGVTWVQVRYDTRYPGSFVSGYPARGVLHTTETTNLPSYSGGATAPNLTIDPLRRRVYQHYSLARPSRALVHPPGVETNNAHCIQIEIVAYSDTTVGAKAKGLNVNTLTASQLDFIAGIMRQVEAATGIRRSSYGLTWRTYPASAGIANGVRMSAGAWRAFPGWCGHEHVYGNDHGDPAAIDIRALLAIPAPPPPPPATTGETEMYAGIVKGESAEWLCGVGVRSWLQIPADRDILTRGGAISASPIEFADRAQLERMLPQVIGPLPPGYTPVAAPEPTP